VAPDAVRPIKSADTAGRVIYLSSFSKTLAPGFRVGWMAAPAPLVERFEIAKQAADLATGTLDQRIACEAMRRGLVERLGPRLRAAYRARRDAFVTALRSQVDGRLSWAMPRGGFCLWATLAGGENVEALLARALFLKARSSAKAWNVRYLVNREGRVIAAFPSKVGPDSPLLIAAVEQALAAK